MSSLSARLLISVSVLLMFFFGVTIVVLDTAFRSAGEQAQADILDGHLMAILAAAEPTDQGVTLAIAARLCRSRVSEILNQGLYAELRDDRRCHRHGDHVPHLGIEIPDWRTASPSGVRKFLDETLADGTPSADAEPCSAMGIS